MQGHLRDFTTALTQLDAPSSCCALVLFADKSAADFEPLLAQLERAGLSTALTVVFALDETEPRELPELLGQLRHEDPEQRGEAARLLGALGSEGTAALPALIHTLDDGVLAVREAAAWALGELEALPELLEILTGPDPVHRQNAAWALGQIGGSARAAIPALIDALRDRDEGVRKAAAWSLEQIFTRDDKARRANPSQNLPGHRRRVRWQVVRGSQSAPIHPVEEERKLDRSA